MKKLISMMLCASYLCACQTFYVNQAMKAKTRNIDEKLPNLEAVFSDESTIKSFSAKDNIIQVNNPMATRFYREVEENLIDVNEDEKKGYIMLTPILIGSNETAALVFLSIASLWTLNILGMPLDVFKGSVELEIKILDINGKLIKKYTIESQNGLCMVAWWGYDINSCLTKPQWDAYENALDKLFQEIKQDKPMLRQKLLKVYESSKFNKAQ